MQKENNFVIFLDTGNFKEYQKLNLRHVNKVKIIVLIFCN